MKLYYAASRRYSSIGIDLYDLWHVEVFDSKEARDKYVQGFYPKTHAIRKAEIGKYTFPKPRPFTKERFIICKSSDDDAYRGLIGHVKAGDRRSLGYLRNLY